MYEISNGEMDIIDFLTCTRSIIQDSLNPRNAKPNKCIYPIYVDQSAPEARPTLICIIHQKVIGHIHSCICNLSKRRLFLTS